MICNISTFIDDVDFTLCIRLSSAIALFVASFVQKDVSSNIYLQCNKASIEWYVLDEELRRAKSCSRNIC
jgi:hypothetical protein